MQTLPPSEACDVALAEMLHSQGFFFTAIGQPEKGKALAEESLTRLQGLPQTRSSKILHHLRRSEHYLGRHAEMKALTQQGLAVRGRSAIPGMWASSCSC